MRYDIEADIKNKADTEFKGYGYDAKTAAYLATDAVLKDYLYAARDETSDPAVHRLIAVLMFLVEERR